MKKEINLMMFMGQSNMAGRGCASEAPVLMPGVGYEYRAITAPDRLSPLVEPFGRDENNELGVTEPGMKTGSMVSAFVEAFYAETQIPVVGVSCAKGGSSIQEWMPGTPYYTDAVERERRCEEWLRANSYDICHKSMVWCQGCTDGDLGTQKNVYKEATRTFLQNYMEECGIETCFLVQIGNRRDDSEQYVPMQEAQEELAAEENNVVMVSRQFRTFAAKGLMKDEFHYLQEGYNLVGAEAGQKAGEFLRKQSD